MNIQESIQKLQEILPANTKKAGANLNHLSCDCPICGKEDKFYINFHKAFKKVKGKYISSWDCKSCENAGNVERLYKLLDKEELLEEEQTINIRQPLELLKFRSESLEVDQEGIDLTLPNKVLPDGFKRLKRHPYLEGRGYTEKDYKHFKIGYCKGNKKLSGYVVFPVYEDGDLKGYYARSTKDKEEIDKINKERKENGIKYKYLRWRNLTGVEYSHLLYGLTDTTEVVKTAIIVEGATDVHNVTRQLNLYEGETKCFGTSGKKLSDIQVQKLINLGIENLYIMFDPEEIDSLKKYSCKNKRKFNVKVVYLNNDKDPGDCSEQELRNAIDNAQSPDQFFYTKLKKLKI